MKPSAQRFLALDVLRGMTVCFMIIVNTPGNGATTWAPLHHASWHGFTPTDLVFPTFMFVVGTAMSITMRKMQELTGQQAFLKILKRTAVIFLLGYLMYWFPFVHYNESGDLVANPIANTRIMGVLQRIALGYFFAAVMIRFLSMTKALVFSAAGLFIYWLILKTMGDPSDAYNMLTNAGNRLDLWIMGDSHLYHGEGVAFDPEGILSTLPSIANVVAGYAAGKWVMEKGKTWEGLTKLLLSGAALIILALFWHSFFPINKKLWTGSFVLLTVGIDCILLAGLIYVTDFLEYKKWTNFFVITGKNPLFVYLLSELGATLLWFFRVGENNTPLYSWLYQTIFQPIGNYWGSFLFAICFMLVCWLAGYWLDKKKIYIRV
ncbi:MAG: DUF5009 domain-containing protein [Chitinophagaceae bacterium]|nr:DUF5009 domain-containing protein [Chitinophagaceae bacterium]